MTMRCSRTVKTFLASVAAAWLLHPFVQAQIEVAEELLVDLDASHPTAGEAVWENQGTMEGFERVGNPFVEDVAGVPAVTFNSGFDLDAYQSMEPAPDGLVGLDPTRTIEVWAYNPDVANEETLVAWGYRGGPNGSNMSFNYGTNASFGAIGHWGGPDIGWNDGGGAPEAGQWHHLVYTYDGAETFTTRVYADGCLIGDFCNAEELGSGVINTHAGSYITLAAQIDNEFGGFNLNLLGTLSIARLRIHDGVLSEQQVLSNFWTEQATYIEDKEPEFVSVPGEGSFIEGAERYQTRIVATGFPPPTIEAVAPVGATLMDGLYSYEIPDPALASFVATVKATNRAGSVEASWTVTRQDALDDIEVAESLLVSLDAAHPSAGDFVWENEGAMADFEIVGEPLSGTVLGVPAVTFNAGTDLDAYRSLEPAAPGLVGLNPTRSIEVWVHNPTIANEETIVSWGRRGGPDGSNMSFNYGTNPDFGAVGHWGDPDLGWSDGGGAPAANAWHHLVYTYDGARTFATRVYADGCPAGEFCNEEVLTAGAINTWFGPIVIAAQVANAEGELNTSRRGTLSVGRLRVHDGVLTEDQVRFNYEKEKDDFSSASLPEFDQVPDSGSYFSGNTTYTANVSAVGTPSPTLEALAPPGATLVDGVFTYEIPPDEPDSFVATVAASNAAGTVEASWTVTRRDLPPEGEIAVAETLLVSLDADDETAGEEVWENQAPSTVGNFTRIGEPLFEEFDAEFEGVAELVTIGAVTFNTSFTQDAYQSEGNAAEGLVGLDATRSVEAWVYNPEITAEETMISWGRRGGPDGSAVSFNYGDHGNYGAVTHWGGDGPDMGWVDNDFTFGAPEAGTWHHLVYTYDGTTTRVYADGELQNSEELGAGVINTHAGFPITIAAQIQDAAGTLNFDGIQGVLSIARIRVHDGVLFPEEVRHNYHTDIADFAKIPKGASLKPGDVNGDAEHNISDPVSQLNFLFSGGPLPACYVVANSDPVQLTSSGLSILDYNGDGASNITDAVASLDFLFGGGSPPALGEDCATVSGECVANCQ